MTRDAARAGGLPPTGRWRPTFSTLAFVVLTVLAVVPILVFGSVESQSRADEVLQAFDEQAAQQTLTAEDLLERVLEGKVEVLKTTVGTLEAIEEWSDADLQRIADAQHRSSGSFNGFYIAGPDAVSRVFAPLVRPDGTKTRAGVDYSDRAYYRELVKNKVVTYSHVQVGRQAKVPHLVIAVPIFDRTRDDTLRGYVAGGIHLSILQSMLQDLLAIDDSVRVVIVDSQKNVLVDSARKLNALDPAPEGSLWTGDCTELQSGLLDSDELGRTLRAACAPFQLGAQTWYVHAGQPMKEILAGVDEARQATQSAAVLALLLAVGISALLATTISRQMVRFQSAAAQIARGTRPSNLRDVPWFSPRELATLGTVVEGTLDDLDAATDKAQGLLGELQLANARMEPLATAWQQVSDAVEVLDARGDVLFVNPAWVSLMGERPSEPVGRPSRLFSTDEIRGWALGETSLLEHLQGGRDWHGEVWTETAKGRLIQGVVVTPVVGDEGSLRVIIVSRRDLTELRQAEDTAALNDRLAGIGTLAAGLAHEINNPLTFVQMNLQLIGEAMDLPGLLSKEEVRGLALDATDGVDRVTRIVQDLLALARNDRGSSDGAPAPVDLHSVAQAAATLARPQTQRTATLTVDVPEGMVCLGREGELIQVVLNLLINAKQALPDRPIADNHLALRGRLEGEEIRLEVEDNGTGIPEDVLGRIFEPLFTTKPVGQGTGLGLSVSRSIVEAHEGRLEVRTVPGEGTCFSLVLPRLTDSAGARVKEWAEAPAKKAAVDAPAAQVLLVDDDPLVGRSLARALRKVGVVVAQSGPEALERLEEHSFSVVVSDVRMPGMNGLELYHAVQEREALPFLFVTGGTTESERAELLRLGCPVLRKPVGNQRLLSEVLALLPKDASSGSSAFQPASTRWGGGAS